MSDDDAATIKPRPLTVWEPGANRRVEPPFVVAHDMPFVAQLIANATEPAAPLRRRKSDRAAPLRAYAASGTAVPRSKAARTV
jgi:hypothetical protein